MVEVGSGRWKRLPYAWSKDDDILRPDSDTLLEVEDLGDYQTHYVEIEKVASGKRPRERGTSSDDDEMDSVYANF